eukprot:8949-Heterococcus_DN1.PRE.1
MTVTAIIVRCIAVVAAVSMSLVDVMPAQLTVVAIAVVKRALKACGADEIGSDGAVIVAARHCVYHKLMYIGADADDGTEKYAWQLKVVERAALSLTLTSVACLAVLSTPYAPARACSFYCYITLQ